MNRIATGSLVVLAFAAGIALLYFGAPFFIPFFVALLISYALAPVVDVLTRLVRWRVLSASIVLGAVLGLIGVAAWAWSDDAVLLWQRVPEAARSIATSLKSANGK